MKHFVKKIIKKVLKLDNSNNKMQTEYIIKKTDIGRLAGKRVIVTGVTGAIGSSVCRRILLEGAMVGMCARNEKKLYDLMRKFEMEFEKAELNISKNMFPLIADVTNDSQVEKAVDEFVEKTGGIDILINNAGGGARKDSKCLYEQDMKIVDDVLNLNLRGSIYFAKCVSKVMVAQNSGKIINMSSVVGMQGKTQMTDYATAKAGIIGFTKSLSMELGQYNITVNCVSPGMVNQTLFDAGLPVRETEKNYIGRFGYTDEVANLVSFIASDDANYITGHNFVIDGGRSLGLKGD